MTEDNTFRVALITGGSKGIGAAIARKLAEDGMIVCITARTKEDLQEMQKEIEAAGGTIRIFPADVTDQSALQSMVDQITSEFGSIDVLVNNAGIGAGGPFSQADIDVWWKLMEINLKGPFMLSRMVIPGMMERNHGTIVNMASFAAVRPSGNTSAYSVSKTALSRLGDCIAVSVSDKNIGVFNISPGLVLTDMTKDVAAFKEIPDEYWSPPEAAAELVSKLASGKYHELSGRFIHVNYDLEEMLKKVERIKEEDLYLLRLPTLSGLQE